MQVPFSILKVLVYFDLFDYPLNQEEIGLFINQKVNSDELSRGLNQLIDSGIIFRFKEFYCLKNDPSWVERRKTGNQKAIATLPTAYRISAFLYSFPFVRGV